MGRGFERGYRKAEEKIKVPHFAYKVPRVERRASAKQGCLYRALKLHKKSNIRFYSNLRMEKKPDRSEIITMILLFALTLVLTLLKVTRVLSLPWLWVLGPLWLGTYRYRD